MKRAPSELALATSVVPAAPIAASTIMRLPIACSGFANGDDSPNASTMPENDSTMPIHCSRVKFSPGRNQRDAITTKIGAV